MFEKTSEDIFVTRFNPNDKLIASGTEYGKLFIHDTKTGKKMIVMAGHNGSESPITSIRSSLILAYLILFRWRPRFYPSRGKNTLVCTNSDGVL